MSGFTVHCYESPGDDARPRRALHTFLYSGEVSDEDLDEAILREISRESIFDEVIFCALPTATLPTERFFANDTAVKNRLEKSTRDLEKCASIIEFDVKTGKHIKKDICGNIINDAEKEIALQKNCLLTEIFHTSNGLVIAPIGYHYRKPSGTHSNSFLRASNTIENSSHIEALTFWLLPSVFGKPIKRIIVDTSGISAVAISLAHRAHTLGILKSIPTVESHASYGGLNKLQIANPNESLFLISASTSGNLAKILVDKGARSENITTLFYLGETPPNCGEVLCDLTKPRNQNGLNPIKNYLEEKCPLCIEKSCPVTIEGDQFSLEPPSIEPITILKSDLEQDQIKTLNSFAGTGVFKVFRTVNDHEFEIYLDVSPFFSPDTMNGETERMTKNEIQDIWKQTLRRSLPFHANRIIYTTYPASKELAEAAKIEFESNNHNQIRTINLHQLQDEEPTASAAALVISACIADASELLAINRELRDKQPKGNTTYLTPIIRYSNKRERDRLISNLTFGDLGNSTFSLFRAKEIKLPRCERNHSWRTELSVLRRMHAWMERSDRKIPTQIIDRITKLEKAPAAGLSEDLFWPRPDNQPLKVRPDFTFINTDGGKRNISQADIFVVISAVLNRLREGLPNKRKLIYRPFERSVISPDNFQRFNDGVIQASILRASRNYELSYSNCSIDLSENLFTLLAGKLSKLNWSEAEAITEFMLALIARKLTLYPQHEQQLCELISGLSNCPDYLKSMAEYHLLELPPKS